MSAKLHSVLPYVLVWMLAMGCAKLHGAAVTDDVLFIHHSVGENWLNNGLRNALLAKSYIDEVNEITYGTMILPDAGRPASLAFFDPPTPGDHTSPHHWLLWFNDYMQRLKSFDCASGKNKIILFKSCFPSNNIYEDGTEPGNPFDSYETLANYRAVYRHPSGAGRTYTSGTLVYKPLRDVFAANPDTLFILVTSPSNVPPCTCLDWADRARVFWNWVKNDWLNGYNAAFPNLKNVAVFDYFDFLAYPQSYTGTEVYDPLDDNTTGTYPVRNMTRKSYRNTEDPTDSHPNSFADQEATKIFATNASNFLDTAYNRWRGTSVRAHWSLYE